MWYKTVATSLILVVLPAVALAQSATQAPPNRHPQTLSPATQAAIGRSRAASNYYPPVTGGQAPARVAARAPFTPPPTSAVPKVVTGPVAAAVPQKPAVTSAVSAALPGGLAANVPPPAPQTVPAPTAAAQPAGPSSDSGSMMAIDYRQGQLSLVADHAPLGKLLALVAAKTGATIEVAPEMAHELVAARLGPATPNEVLTSLLDGPKLDYIILGADGSGSVLKVIVRRNKNFMGQPAMAALYTPRAMPSNADLANNQAAQEQSQAAAQAPAAEATQPDGTAAAPENPPTPK